MPRAFSPNEPHYSTFLLFLLMNMDLTFHNIAECESGAAHERARLVICSSASVLTLSSKQKEAEDLKSTLLLIKIMKLPCYTVNKKLHVIWVEWTVNNILLTKCIRWDFKALFAVPLSHSWGFKRFQMSWPVLFFPVNNKRRCSEECSRCSYPYKGIEWPAVNLQKTTNAW